MKRFRKWIQKDRYGVVRGTLLLCIVMLLCTCMVIQLFYSYDLISEKERAGNAALHVGAQFECLIDTGAIQLTAAAAMIEENSLDVDHVLQGMIEHSVFSEVAVADRLAEQPDYINSIRYEINTSAVDIHSDAEGGLRFYTQMFNGSELTGKLDIMSLEAVLCDAFIEDYGYAVFNAATGAYILNNTSLDDEGYFEALRNLQGDGNVEELINAGDAQVKIERNGASDGDYYIAQKLTNVRPLGIALMIPEDLVRSAAWTGRIMPHATMAAAVLMLIILISYTVFSLRRVRMANKNAAKALDMGEHMMNVISHEARITLFSYQRKQDFVSNCYDGLALLGDAGVGGICSLRDIEKACGMDDIESEHLRKCFLELKEGEQTELLVHANPSDHEESILRFTLCASIQEDGGVICCISDCTQEQVSLDRVELERSYQASVEAKTSSIWQINISRNRWRMLSVKRSSAMFKMKDARSQWCDYNADLGSLLRNYLHPADYPDYAETMSVVGIASMYRSGKTEFTKDYRVCRDDGTNYEWHRMCIRIWLNPENNDIFANLYVFNVNAEKDAELERGERKRVLQQTMMALGGIYYGLYYVDLENNLSYTARSLGGDLVTQLCAPYKETFDGYIDSAVHPEDRQALRNLLSAYHLRKQMTEGSHFQRLEYRRKSGESYEQAAIIVQPARYENGIVKEVVLAIRYV